MIGAHRAALLGASGGTPAGLPSGAHSWFDATEITPQTDDTDLTTWADISGNGRDATQATAANKPHYRTAGNGIGSLPAVDFDGSNDELVQSAFTAISQPNTVLAVTRRAATNRTDYLFDGIDAVNNRHAFFGTNTGGSTIISASSLAGPAWNVTTPVVIAVVFNTTSSYARINQTGSTPGSVGSESLTGLVIGSSGGAFFFAGLIGELILYDRLLTTDEIEQSELFLADKWGITL